MKKMPDPGWKNGPEEPRKVITQEDFDEWYAGDNEIGLNGDWLDAYEAWEAERERSTVG